MKTYKFTIEINGVEMKTTVWAYTESQAKDKLWEIIRHNTSLVGMEVEESPPSFKGKAKELFSLMV